MRRLVPRCKLVRAVDRDSERPDVVVRRGDVVREAAVRTAVAVIGLLAQEAEARLGDDDVVCLGVRGPVAVDALRMQRRALEDRAQQGLRFSRIAGNLPFRSQAWKKNCQSMNGTSSESVGSTSRVPTNGGVGSSIGETVTRLARAWSSVRSGLRIFSAC